MADRASRQAAGGPLTATLSTSGARPKISLGDRAAAVADLRLRLTGGTPDADVTATVTVTLSLPLARSRRAQLIDEAASRPVASATTSGSTLAFKKVKLPRGSRFRIVNVRANASAISSAFGPVMAKVTISATPPIAVSNADLVVASLVRPRLAAGRKRVR